MPGNQLHDPHNLQRFVTAQAPVYDRVLAELRAGRKQTHWMWFIFPQLRGLGHSDMARRFAIASLAEADAYLQHAVLGRRLRECSALVAQIEGRTIGQIFGSPDDMKFHSCMTLFAQTNDDRAIFLQCLDKYFGGEMDRATLAGLAH
jgi:uncharacterized protein (DUF1810 family)